MKEIKGDIWDYHNKGYWIVITTNGTVKSNGEAVMGRGVALQAKNRFPQLPKEFGRLLKDVGNHVHFLPPYKIVTFPVKYRWQERADFMLIERSCQELNSVVSGEGKGYFLGDIYMVRPGCGNGGLDWKDVRPILEKYLDDRFIIVEIG